MSSRQSEAKAPRWAELLAVAVAGGRGRELAERLGEQLLGQSQLEALAIYAGAEGRGERVLAVGEPVLPSCVSELESSSAGRFDFPGGLVAYLPASADCAALDEQAVLTLLCARQAAALGGRLKQQSFEAKYRGVELQSLYDVGLAIARTLDLEQLGDEVLLRAVSLLDARVGALYLYDGANYHLDRTFGGEARPSVAADDPALEMLLEGRPCGDGALLPETEHPLAMPIEADDKRLGLLVVADKESRQGVGAFGEGDRRMLGLFANQAAIALENAHLHRQALEKERLERELDLAADIQRQLLPKSLPIVEGFEFAGWSRPVRHVGGDYYDVRRADDGDIYLVLGDVTGKGMPAALLVSTLHSALRLLLGARPFDAALIERLNRHIAEASASNKFITMTAAKLDPASGRIAYVNAGHNPPLIVRQGGAVEELPPGGMPLGMFGGATYAAGEVELSSGDLLCIFSDGITECERPGGEEYGPERLTELLLMAADRPLSEVMSAIDEGVVDFAAGGPQGDDQTVVLVRRA